MSSQKIHQALVSDELKSSRMYLWKNPGTSLKLKQLLRPKRFLFNEENSIKLLDRIKATLELDGDLDTLDFLFDVMMPEVTIHIVRKNDGVCRYMAELCLASGSVFE